MNLCTLEEENFYIQENDEAVVETFPQQLEEIRALQTTTKNPLHSAVLLVWVDSAKKLNVRECLYLANFILFCCVLFLLSSCFYYFIIIKFFPFYFSIAK